MRSAEERRRCPEGQWVKFSLPDTEFIECTETQECDYDQKARVVNEQFGYYGCEPRCSSWGEYTLVPIDPADRQNGMENFYDVQNNRATNPRRAELVSCRGSGQCLEGQEKIILSADKLAFRCKEPEPKQEEPEQTGVH